MSTRTQTSTLVFRRPFRLKDVEGWQPAGTYTLETEEELLEGLSFPAYRRIATMLMFQPTLSSGTSQALLVDPAELEAVVAADAKDAPVPPFAGWRS